MKETTFKRGFVVEALQGKAWMKKRSWIVVSKREINSLCSSHFAFFRFCEMQNLRALVLRNFAKLCKIIKISIHTSKIAIFMKFMINELWLRSCNILKSFEIDLDFWLSMKTHHSYIATIDLKWRLVCTFAFK